MIGIYLDKVMPREFGKAEPWNFLCKSKRSRIYTDNVEDEKHDPELVKSGNFEKDADYLKRGESLRIRNLKKVYENGFTAVHNESMTMYKGQIFALLGHNGAGKTTTISMLTGLIEPSEG
jgi:ATP-binding cassette, subfamily A (ABC1), member 3